MNLRRVAVPLALMPALVLGGCGEIKNTINPKPSTANQLTVELAGPPNAYDVGLYAAQALGYFKQTDINVTFQTPTVGQNPLTLLHDGKVPVAISSEPSVFLARQHEEPVVAVAALVRDPITQIPLTVAATKTGASGGKSVAGSTTTTATATTATTTTTTSATTSTATTTTPATTTATTTTPTTTLTTTTGTTTTTTPVTTTTLTTTEVPTGSQWPAQLQTLLAQPNAPTYNGLVVVVRKGTIVDHAPLIRRFVQAVERGYKAVRRDPAAGVADLIAANPTLAGQEPELEASVEAAMPHFFPPNSLWGWQTETNWNKFGTWLTTNKLITNPNAVVNASTNELLAGEGV